jgi:4-alpha-glucanotransferase
VIEDKNKYQRKKAYRQIALFFQRAYTSHTGEKFGTWKQKTKAFLHLKKIMRRSVEHYERNYKEAVQRVFLRFLSDERRKERLAEIK